ncbi:hypothetical protein DdX_20169 [Ditylenchus destructor]|uniref:Uncharacterized protein n=1 Tax=Ditylenchus destructor TaxID=166010 RepID=A0AAD4QWF8_9BILA|nr:hypothetical protein DdX_20169 [Ditylenchus destructor]
MAILLLFLFFLPLLDANGDQHKPPVQHKDEHKGEALVEVHIKGTVHLKLQKKSQLLFYRYYKVPNRVMVRIKPHTPDGLERDKSAKITAIESKECSNHKSEKPHECHYSGTFYVREGDKKFQVTAQVEKYPHNYGPEAAYTPQDLAHFPAHLIPTIHKDGKFHEVEVDFVLDFPSKKKGTTPGADPVFQHERKHDTEEMIHQLRLMGNLRYLERSSAEKVIESWCPIAPDGASLLGGYSSSNQ